jgi:single-stranded-DNA-specific exonuclease
MEKRWRMHTPDEETVRSLARSQDIHPAVAAALVNRGVCDAEAADRFILPRLTHLADPFSIKDMDIAAKRLVRAIQNKETVLVFGDYDADGCTACALMVDFLQEAGARVFWYVPHRTSEGYGMRPEHVERVMAPLGAHLVVTVDCGTSDCDAVRAAGQAGIDVIVTDHHEPPGTLPPALAVVNPKREDCAAGLEHLAGVGVAFFLCVCLRALLREAGHWENRPEPNLKRLCGLVALGTIGDIAPLVADNRILVKAGLEVLATSPPPGIAALMEVARIQPHQITARDLGYSLAPRINAAGRMEHADRSVELLLARAPSAAKPLALLLDEQNRRRQEEEKAHFDSIMARAAKNPSLVEGHAIVLSDPGWNQGVVGIVASRLARHFNRPVVLICEGAGMAKGSGRSVPGLDMHAAFTSCAALLSAYGGHAMAAGLSLALDNIPIFARRFKEAVASAAPDLCHAPQVWIDWPHPIPLKDLGPAFAQEVETLGPFGEKNREPVFYATDILVPRDSWRAMGHAHRRMRCVQGQGDVEAVWFNAVQGAPPGGFPRLAFRVERGRHNGGRCVQLVVESL